jgi:dienelactone hydrolase
VTYYCVMPHGEPDFAKISGAVVGHFGTADEFVSLRTPGLSKRSWAPPASTFEFYGGAGLAVFNDTNRLGAHPAEAAARSWDRTLACPRER